MKILKGKPVSPGIVCGKALIYNYKKEVIFKEKINYENIKTEILRLKNSIKKTKSQLKKIKKDLQQLMGEDSALIIETQYLLLNDSKLIEEIEQTIKSSLVKAEWAIKKTEKKYIDIFTNINDLSFKERINDIQDLLYRIIKNLKKNDTLVHKESDKFILIADDLPPSEAAKLITGKKLLGIALERGGETSHTVILAKSLEIPAIINTKNILSTISNDDDIVLDSLNGQIVVNPPKSLLLEVSIKKEKYNVYKERLKEIKDLKNITRDNHEFNLMANIELPVEADIALSYGANGIGLFRTEFLFSEKKIINDENEQYLIYKNISQKIYPKSVVIRTFDIGRDKFEELSNSAFDKNPALGTMAVRLFLKKKDIFKTQIKAIIRANELGNIKILFPMVSEIEEVNTILSMINEAEKELNKKNKLPEHKIQKGIMIEIPAAIKLIKYLKNKVDFFSIGTNDLIQYLIAVDRNNTEVSYLFSHYHPAVIDNLKEIKREADKINKPVTICGEMAGNLFSAILLIGLGFKNLSMNPLSIAEIKRVLINIDYSYLNYIVNNLTYYNSKTAIEEFLIESLISKYPDLFLKQPLF